MKFTIKAKLFLITSIPIITLIILSAHNLDEKYTNIQHHNKQLQYTNSVAITNNLVHELQIERGLTAGFLNTIDQTYFTKNVHLQTAKTDTMLQKFLTIKENSFLIKSAKQKLHKIREIRESVFNKKIKPDKLFKYYTETNTLLLEYVKTLQITSSKGNFNKMIIALQKMITLKEYAGQERALALSLIQQEHVPHEDLKHFDSLLFMQDLEKKNLINLLNGTQYKQKFEQTSFTKKGGVLYSLRKKISIYEEKKNTLNEIYRTIGFGGIAYNYHLFRATNDKKYFNNILTQKELFDREIKHYASLVDLNSKEYSTVQKLSKSFENILKNPGEKLNSEELLTLYTSLESHPIEISAKRWFQITSARINKFNNFSNTLLQDITKDIEKEQSALKESLTIQFQLVLFIIFVLLLGSYLTARNITQSIHFLNNGLDKFFHFLNTKTGQPKVIEINSNDEIREMANTINMQIAITQKNIEEDQDFIQEATQVVMMMKEGDFSERIYFEPNNQSLQNFKDVLNELINLIVDKIDAQTKDLERLNSSLEDQVFHQTNELMQQVEELTKARDIAVQAEIAKDEFLANMSHEIRTPLNAILGFVTILQKRVTEEKSLHYLSIIDSSGKSLLTIINDILDFSKIQSGKFVISPYQIASVQEFSTEMLLFASKAYEKNIIYSVYIDPNMPSSISVDLTRVNQIISNLLSNAIKFTPEDGEIKVKVTIVNSTLIVSIQDNGIGIPLEHQSKIFSAFEQADGSTTRKYGGTGLGLSISSKLAELMNGTLTFTSSEDKGSTFTLKLPITILNKEATSLIDAQTISQYKFAILNSPHSSQSQVKLMKKYLTDFGVLEIIEMSEYKAEGYDILFFIPDDDYNESIVSASHPAIAMLRTSSIKLADFKHIEALYAPFVPSAIVEAINDIGLEDMKSNRAHIEKNEDDELQFRGNVLVAEDNKTNQMLISLMLDDYGIDYKIANNGVEAVRMFKEESYDLVLMDENMPELNGIGAMLQIKEYEKDKAFLLTPIVALTASVLESDKAMFLDAGMDGFVGKPINSKELEMVFTKYLKRI